MKICVFDDHVLLTGANTSEIYFTYRTDRYIILKNTPRLADFLEDSVNAILDCCH